MSAHPAAVYDLPTYFIDEGSHKFRTELPNLVDDLGLNIYAHSLYAHVKRRAGDSGKSTAGLRSMAKACGMSPGSAAKARQELLDLGLIRRRIEIVRHETGGGRYEVLTAADIWPANFTFYERLKRRQLKPLTAETRAAAARAPRLLPGREGTRTGRRRRARARSYGDSKMRVHILHHSYRTGCITT